jgi:hypothetical protein
MQETMSPGFPNSSQFSADKICEYTGYWNWHRDHDTGEANYGQDMHTPDDSVLIGYIINIELEHHTQGAPDIYMLKKDLGLFQIPHGVHVGHKLEPEDFFGAINLNIVIFLLVPLTAIASIAGMFPIRS